MLLILKTRIGDACLNLAIVKLLIRLRNVIVYLYSEFALFNLLQQLSVDVNFSRGKTTNLRPKIQILQNVTGRLAKIYLYPVKSGGPFQVKQSWKLTNIGLEYDRRWMIVNALGSCVSQKDIKSLCTLKPTLDFHNRTLRLQINGYYKL